MKTLLPDIKTKDLGIQQFILEYLPVEQEATSLLRLKNEKTNLGFETGRFPFFAHPVSSLDTEGGW